MLFNSKDICAEEQQSLKLTNCWVRDKEVYTYLMGINPKENTTAKSLNKYKNLTELLKKWFKYFQRNYLCPRI